MSTTSRLIPEADLACLRRTSPRRQSIHRSSSVSAKAGGPLRFFTNARWIGWLGLVMCWPAAAATLLVWPASPNPTTPYRDWATAAHTIQDAVDAARQGDTVLVTNGVYATGGRAVVPATLTNRVAVTKPLTLRSVNGPEVTVIQGYQVPAVTNGNGAVRCVFLTNAAMLNGFTLTGGATRPSDPGGVGSNSGGGVFCTSTNATVTNCILAANAAARFGGGVYSGTLIRCTLIANSASGGGGAWESAMADCLITGNSADSAGGTYGGTLDHCTLTGNSARAYSGGAEYGTLYRCTLTSNTAGYSGGGAAWATLKQCVLAGNSAGPAGGGAYQSTLNHCTLTGNCAASGGGAYRSSLTNSIVYYNTGLSGEPNYDRSSTLDHCCTSPLPESGVGNIGADPLLASAVYLTSGSPCRGAGDAANTLGVDLDGEPWLASPSIGCDEYTEGTATGPVTTAIESTWTNVSVGFAVDLTGRIEGRVSASAWDFGDGTGVTNRPYVGHAWAVPGDHVVVLTAYNETHPLGVTTAMVVRVVPQAVHHVRAGSTNPVPPYGSWATAAGTIQDAVDHAVPGGRVSVTNGFYATGGRAVQGGVHNRVAVTKPVTIRSVSGPVVTVIHGGGSGSGRCVYLVDRAVLDGFTLTGGRAPSRGIADEDNAGGGVICLSTAATVTNCILSGNSASGGGGACGGTLSRCILSGNSATSGGGAAAATLNDCTLTNNAASNHGGGAVGCTLNRCLLASNSARLGGGGAYSATLNHCTVSANWATNSGGGASSSTLNQCVLTGNSAETGGGASGTTLNHCTLTSNWAEHGGGVYGGTLSNCIVYYNTAPGGGPNYYGSSTAPCVLDYSCAAPLPDSGVGNIDVEPELASTSHLSAASPCRGAGDPASSTGLDIDGEPWLDPPSIGCDEYTAGTATGALTVAIDVTWTHVSAGFDLDLIGQIEGRASASTWDFGDGTGVSNRLHTRHSWAAPGYYLVVLTAYNESYPAGVSAAVPIHVETRPVHYVCAESAWPTPPYGSWWTAARTIQDAVDAASALGALVLVTNGVYATGGRAVEGTMTNRVAVTRPMTLRSVNGPEVTVIQGYQVPGKTNGNGAIRCVYLADRAVLSGFTLTNGATGVSSSYYNLDHRGGGVWCASTNTMVTNCTLTANSAEAGGGAYRGTLDRCLLTDNLASLGGGAHEGTLKNCLLARNSAYQGGGVSFATVNNCTLTENSAGSGGGAWVSTLNNCIAYDNAARSGSASNYVVCTLNYSCTTPLPSAGIGNIDAEPQWASLYRLSMSSPCRAGGAAAFATGQDIDGEPWLSPPSIGCDEYTAGAVTGALTVTIEATLTNVSTGSVVGLTAGIGGRASASVWDFGDGTLVTNRPRSNHAWAVPGDYPVRVTAYNETYPEGVSATTLIHVVFPVRYVSVDSATPIPPYSSWATAARTIQDAVDTAQAGDVVLVTNGVYATGGRAVSGTMTNRVVVDRAVELRSINGPEWTAIEGYQVPGMTNGDGAIRCVYLTKGAALNGFTLTKGATRGYDYADVFGELSGGGVWCASRDAVITNCVFTRNSARVYGGGTYRGTLDHCLLKDNSAGYGGGVSSALLNGCTLTGNSASEGGGAHSAGLNRCTVTDNSASGSGGGVAGVASSHCIITGNRAGQYGGGVYSGTLDHCIVEGNSAEYGGGIYSGTVNNCVIYHNLATSAPNHVDGTFSYSCTVPLPDTAIGIITNEPAFVDPAGGNYRLQANSPCINAGNNAYVSTATDLDGNPRIVGGTVDIGAYEFQTPTSLLSYAWAQQYGLPTDGSADYAEPDGDGLNNWLEWLYGTDPTNALSALSLFPPTIDASGVTLSWGSITNHTYLLERSSDLGASPAFLPLATNLVGQAGTSSFTDTNPPSPGFYRLGIQP